MDDFECFQLLNGLRKGVIHVTRIDHYLAQTVAALTTAVWLSDASCSKQRQRHGELTFNEYGFIPIVIRYGMAIQDRDGSLNFLYEDTEIFGETYQAHVKITGYKHELYLDSFHRIGRRDIRRLQRRGILLRQHSR